MYRRSAKIFHRTSVLRWENILAARRLCKNLSTSSSCLVNEKTRSVPDEARVVICGGGVVGASVAYHLAENGWNDVILLEQGRLTGGTTWHAAGLVGRIKPNPVEIKMMDYSRKLYDKLEKEEYGTGWKECGSMSVARNSNRITELRRLHDIAESIGVETHMIDTAEIGRLCPLLRTDDLLGALWIPNDGVANPTDVSMALVKKAKEKGVRVFENVMMEQVRTENGRVKSVKTSQGDIKCDVFVNCSGQWSREVGAKTVPEKVTVPLYSCEHYYVVTKAQPGIGRMMPVIRDYDGFVYVREWNGGILGGGFEPGPKTCFHDGVPENFEFQLLPEDWDQFQVLMDNILHRVPSLETAEVRQLTNGPESFTPDARWIVGQSPQVKNYFIAAGMNSKGIAGAGGIGHYLSEWIVNGQASEDMWSFDVRRFLPMHSNKTFLRERIPETLTHFGAVGFPKREYETARNLRCSPLHAKLEASGAVFGETMSYERPLFFADAKDEMVRSDIWETWSNPVWFPNVEKEVEACKERVGISDISSLSKFEVKSIRDEATNFLQYLCSSNLDEELGTVVDTGMQNVNGGFETFCTVTRLDMNHYFITCLAPQHTRVLSWLKFHLPASGAVQVSDVTSTFSGMALIGPLAQQLLAEVSGIRTAEADFQPMTMKTIDVGGASHVRAMRLTHTGEDGFILYVPSECAVHVYDTLMSAGKDHGISHVGHFAVDHLRVENRLPFWGLDLDDKTTPLECGQTFHPKLDSVGDFVGKEALMKQEEEGVGRRFTQFVLDDFNMDKDSWPWKGEPIYRNGKFAGHTTTCGYGFSLKKMVCLGFISDIDEMGKAICQHDIDQWVLKEQAHYEIIVAGERHSARPVIDVLQTSFPKEERVDVPAQGF